MEDNTNLTMFQKLSQAFGLGTPKAPDQATKYQYQYNSPIQNREIVLKTDNKQEYEREKLERQQQAYLVSQWTKTDSELYRQAIYYETTRLASYYDLEAMEYSIHGDTKIATPDGFITIKELADKGRDHEFIVYSYDHNNQKIVSARAKNAHCTRNEMTYKITFADGNFIIATHGHRFLKYKGVYSVVEDLKVGDLMMSFYDDIRLTAQMTMSNANNTVANNLGWDNIINAAQTHKTLNQTSEFLQVDPTSLLIRIVNDGYYSWETFCQVYEIDEYYGLETLNNHHIQIISIEPYGIVPVYDLTVPGFKNFATDSIFSHNTPEISAALDIFSEEATTAGDNGKILNVYSDSKRVKKVLESLFYNTLDINTNLPPWTRNAVKYGDNFIFLKIDRERGIVGCTQLPNIEIERKEYHADSIYRNITNEKQPGIQFNWKNKDLSFQSWEIAHFRLVGDDRRLPYGTSILEKARRIWKQLLLCVASDTEIYTIDGIKQIKDIKSNDIIYSFDPSSQKVIQTRVNNCAKTGDNKTLYRVRTNYNSIDVTDNHPIMVWDGKNYQYKTIKDINTNKDKLVCPAIDNGNSSYSVQLSSDGYSVQLNEAGLNYAASIDRKNIVQKIIKNIDSKNYKNVHAFLNGKRKIKYSLLPQLLTTFGITIDMVDVYYGKSITVLNKDLTYQTNPEISRIFGFMLGDGWLQKNTFGYALGVDEIQNQFYHDLMVRQFGKKIRINYPVIGVRGGQALIDSKELVNLFKKLGFITGFKNKRIPDWVFNLNIENRLQFIRGLFDADGSDRWGVIGLSNKHLITDYRRICQMSGYGVGKISEKKGWIDNKDNIIVHHQDTYKLYINFKNRTDLRYQNILSIEELGNDEVWDLSVDSNIHNFIGNGVVVHNCEDAMLIYRTSRAPERRVFKVFVGNMDDDDVEAYVQKVANKFKRSVVVDSATGQIDTRYNQLAVDQDFFIPVRDPNAPNPIDTLPGASNLAEIADVEYIQRKLFAAIRTPKAFLGFEDVAGDGKNLALKDIRFARTINRVQQSMIQELNKIAIIHLYVLGFEDEIDNFTLTLNNPSTQAELMKIESLKEKALLYKDLVSDAGNGFSITSMTWAKKEVMGFSEDEIRLDLEQQRLEKAAANEIAKTTEVIIHTGIFDNIDKIFGKRADQEGEAPAAGGEAGGAGGGGGGSFGGLGGDLGGAEGGLGGGDMGGGGGEFPAPGEESAVPGEEDGVPPTENEVEEEGHIRKNDDRPLLIENRISYDLNEMLNNLDKLIAPNIDDGEQ